MFDVELLRVARERPWLRSRGVRALVLSPATETLDRGKKLRIYAREGVSHTWFVSPMLRTLEVWSLASRTFTLVESHEGSVNIRAVPFDAIEFDLGALWI